MAMEKGDPVLVGPLIYGAETWPSERHPGYHAVSVHEAADHLVIPFPEGSRVASPEVVAAIHWAMRVLADPPSHVWSDDHWFTLLAFVGDGVPSELPPGTSAVPLDNGPHTCHYDGAVSDTAAEMERKGATRW